MGINEGTSLVYYKNRLVVQLTHSHLDCTKMSKKHTEVVLKTYTVLITNYYEIDSKHPLTNNSKGYVSDCPIIAL